MEFGGLIRAYLDAQSRCPIPMGEVCSHSCQIPLCAEHLHDNSIIHYDLKDTSIFVNNKPHVRQPRWERSKTA